MKEQILKMLMEADDFVSGQSICEALNVSRTAVWKAVSALKEDGFVIESVTNKGYRLSRMSDKLTAEAIKSHLKTSFIGKKLDVLDEVDSTNTYLKKKSEEMVIDGYTAATQKQVAGRGRRGKVWETPEGTNIAVSFILKPDIVPNDASMITLIAALAVAGAISDITGQKPQIKWPNDVLLGGRKVCGILTEMSLEMTAINYVVVGIGVNVNNTSFPEEIADIAGSILSQTGIKVDRSELLAGILNHFEKYYMTFLKTTDLTELKDIYENYLVNIQKTVRIIEKDEERLGVALGIDERGGLMVSFNDHTEIITGGEVSVRGIYGYV